MAAEDDQSTFSKFVFGCLAAILTAGSLIPGVAAPNLLPGIASLNGIIVAILAHVVGYYALERSGILAGHRVPEGAKRV